MRLRALAAAHGIATSYRSVAGTRVVATDRALVGVLTALGVATGSEQELASALVAAQASASQPPSVVVARADRGSAVLLPPISGAPRRVVVTVRAEGGEERSLPLAELIVDRERPDGRRVVGLGSFRLAPGYHELVLEGPRIDLHATLLLHPGRARLPPRGFGVFSPLYGLRSSGDWGVGSTAELETLARWAASAGASFVGTLPLYPSYFAPVAEVSPYRPVSRVAWNEIYLDVAHLPEVELAPEAVTFLSSARTRRRLRELRSTPRVEYTEVEAAKRAVLGPCARIVREGPRGRAFAAYLAAHPEARAYAAFRAEREAGTAAERRATTRYHEYGQFAMDAALGAVAASGTPLYLDLPVGVHPQGFDPVGFPEAFLSGASVGAPPDPFFAGGQSWNVPPLHPTGLRDRGFAYLRATYQHVFRHASVVRIDHVMGLERCFVIPDGLEPTEGAYLHYPSAEVRAVLEIEAARAGTTLVGEDLGTVPAATHRAMGEDGMLRSAVYSFTASPKDLRPKTPRRAVASFGSHDLPRFGGFLRGVDVAEGAADGSLDPATAAALFAERRGLRAGLATPPRSTESPEGGATATEREADDDTEELRRAYRSVLEWLGETRAALALVDLGDLVGDTESENRPGPTSGATSWRHRLPVPLEAITTDPRYLDLLTVVAAGRPFASREAR